MGPHRSQQNTLIMRKITLLTAVFLGLVAGISSSAQPSSQTIVEPITKRDAGLQAEIDSWPKGAETNGIFCAISFAPSSWKGSPVFYVNLVNATTNLIRGFLRIPFEGHANI